jgi:hypothetical protein
MPGELIKEMFADARLKLTDDEKQRITAWRVAPGRRIEWHRRVYCDNLAAKYPFVVDYYLHGGREALRDAVRDVAALLRTDASLPDSAGADTVALTTPANFMATWSSCRPYSTLIRTTGTASASSRPARRSSSTPILSPPPR